MLTQDCTVTVSIGEKEFSEVYQQVVRSSITTDDVLELLSDPKTAQQVINDYHYGSDLRAKAEVRNSILTKVGGPEKAFEKSVKEFMKLRAANGKPISEEKARLLIQAMQDSE